MIYRKLREIIKKDSFVLQDNTGGGIAKIDSVNLNAWIMPDRNNQNIGDWLSLIIVDDLLQLKGLSLDDKVETTKHLYAIGSILLHYQDMTVWGSGFARDVTLDKKFKLYSLFHRIYHKTDIRAVRGPLTRACFLKMGIECPDVFGDPAILLPRFYTPIKCSTLSDYTVIPHCSTYEKYRTKENTLHPFTDNWQRFVNRLYSSKLIISSSLHGIILAEAYGIPAILLHDEDFNLFKFRDWYESTGRTEFPIAKSVGEALNMEPALPDPKQIEQMQNRLLSTFPYDLWGK